jgi:hypothetical protein
MTVLFAITKDLVRFLIIVDMGAAMIIWALGFRERFLMMGHTPEWRGWFSVSLRLSLPSKYPRAYYVHLRQSTLYGLVFLVMLGIGAPLMLLDDLFFKTAAC